MGAEGARSGRRTAVGCMRLTTRAAAGIPAADAGLALVMHIPVAILQPRPAGAVDWARHCSGVVEAPAASRLPADTAEVHCSACILRPKLMCHIDSHT